MVSSPVIHYNADEAHIFRYIRDPGTPRAKMYEDHYSETVRQITQALPNCKIISHEDHPIYDLHVMAGALESLRREILTAHPG